MTNKLHPARRLSILAQRSLSDPAALRVGRARRLESGTQKKTGSAWPGTGSDLCLKVSAECTKMFPFF